MSKCHDGGFLSLYQALSRDIVRYDPTLAVDMDRDIKRIISNVNHRGLSVILKDLPEIAKVLELSLSAERLSRSNLPFMGGFKHGSPIPRLFKGLWMRIFDVNGCLQQDIDPTYISFLEQLCSLGKKVEVDPPAAALFEATKEFLDVDQALPPPTLDWSIGSRAFGAGSDLSIVQLSRRPTDQYDLFGSDDSSDTQLLDTIQRVADVVSSDLGEFIPPISSRHGRGAVYEDLRGVEKFSNISWPQRLGQTFPKEGFFSPVGRIGLIETGDYPSKLLAVPKTIKGPRLIAKEPTAHMYAQLSIMDWIYAELPSKVAGISINFRDQTLSGEMALEASRTGSHGTIDLKSASDRVSLWLVERLFRRNASLLRAMADCRTQYVDLSIDKKLPSLHKLRKFTTQGSALTFPIQSIVFFIITVGTMMNGHKGTINRRSIARIAKDVRIFGDDIIAPSDRVEDIIRSLERLYLKVNTQKTHYHGFFRESCGVRAYKGVDVTPSYVPLLLSGQRKLAEYPRIIENANNFAKKWLFELSNAVISTIPQSFLNGIPTGRYKDQSIVLHSFSGSRISPTVKVRWNDRYQREEAYVFVERSKKTRLKVDGSLLLDAFLAMRETRPALLTFEGLDDWYPLSRWEARAVVARAWVPFTP